MPSSLIPIWNRSAECAVVRAAANYRPAIVVAGLDSVNLVTALRAVFRFPEITCFRVYRQTLWAAMSVAPNLRKYVGLSNEGVVVRYGSVVIKAHNNTLVIASILRRVCTQRCFISNRRGPCGHQVSETYSHRHRRRSCRHSARNLLPVLRRSLPRLLGDHFPSVRGL